MMVVGVNPDATSSQGATLDSQGATLDACGATVDKNDAFLRNNAITQKCHNVMRPPAVEGYSRINQIAAEGNI